MASNRKTRLSNLRGAVKDYVKKERTRLEDEVSVLEGIRDGRGHQVDSVVVKYTEAVAMKDLADFLSGA